MWIKASTGLADGVFQVTTPVSSHLIIAGAHAALVDSSITAMSTELIDAVAPLVSGEVMLKFLLLTHTHFDHCGGIAALRKQFPDLQVVGSPESAELLAQRGYKEQLYKINGDAAAALGRSLDISAEEFSKALRIDRILGEGDTVDLGDGVDVKIVGCPGHTVDSVGFYSRAECVLAAGEAVGGYHGRERLAPAFMSSFEDYVGTLDRLAGLDVKVLSLSHAGALTGDLPKKFLLEARVAAERFRDAVKERFEAGELKEGIVTELFSEWGIEGFAPDGPFVPASKECLAQMVRIVAEDM